MKVYRLCNQTEIDKILKDESFENVGSFYQNNSEKTSLKYEKDKKYLHFFNDKYSTLYLGCKKGQFICTYDIPDKIIKQRLGYGNYKNIVNPDTIDLVPEYAMETDLLKFEQLSSVGKLVKDIDFKDFFFNPYFKGLIENYYNRENVKGLGNE